jgi:hypothetical protein
MKTPELEVYNDLLLGAFVSPVVDKKNGLRLARELCTKLAVRSSISKLGKQLTIFVDSQRPSRLSVARVTNGLGVLASAGQRQQGCWCHSD